MVELFLKIVILLLPLLGCSVVFHAGMMIGILSWGGAPLFFSLSLSLSRPEFFKCENFYGKLENVSGFSGSLKNRFISSRNCIDILQ